ncbi:DUF2630 family protein [Nocardioides pocheonensis]|jgi:hypothetical protein|uniref:DUF2630 family protein n=1 Tax=Nocardioides pocheonensis TaxID=661485 RepID=A0A3N0GVB1_9ACTN|nr:DUF2630 family protein [Nocardioides pocheonensis]RNM16339.1 DUF2630 family protein [Nocardioides pocheonensis]
MTTDDGIHAQISELVARERALRAQLQAGEIDRADEQAQLRELEVQLDQCWDLLRQREALRDSGGDPASASVRPASEVEGYLG